MTNQEIKSKIDENNKIIESLLKPGQFVLNEQISDLLKQNESLRAECTHQFENGYCVFCGTKEEN